jgi:hypothetical protein
VPTARSRSRRRRPPLGDRANRQNPCVRFVGHGIRPADTIVSTRRRSCSSALLRGGSERQQPVAWTTSHASPAAQERESPAFAGLPHAPKRTRTSTRLSRTRPSTLSVKPSDRAEPCCRAISCPVAGLFGTDLTLRPVSRRVSRNREVAVYSYVKPLSLSAVFTGDGGRAHRDVVGVLRARVERVRGAVAEVAAARRAADRAVLGRVEAVVLPVDADVEARLARNRMRFSRANWRLMFVQSSHSGPRLNYVCVEARSPHTARFGQFV